MNIILIGILILTIFFIIFLVFWTVAGIMPVFFGAPWVPTSFKKIHKMLKLAQLKPNEVVYDLGSGDGRALIIAARNFSAQAVGIEINPLYCFFTKLAITIFGLRKEVKIICGDFFAQDLTQADVVICYLTQPTNKKLMKKFEKELRPGTRIISHVFTFPKWQIIRKDEEECLYMYQT